MKEQFQKIKENLLFEKAALLIDIRTLEKMDPNTLVGKRPRQTEMGQVLEEIHVYNMLDTKKAELVNTDRKLEAVDELLAEK